MFQHSAAEARTKHLKLFLGITPYVATSHVVLFTVAHNNTHQYRCRGTARTNWIPMDS